MSRVLVSNPGTASRKYALFDGDECKLRLHFEREDSRIVCTTDNKVLESRSADVNDLSQAVQLLPDILRKHGADAPDAIALRIVAPSSYFLQHRRLDQKAIAKLRELERHSPLHIRASLQELGALQAQWPDVPVFGISDSAFHAAKPDYAWNYGIRLEDADRFDIKRFGYHGISAQSVVEQLGRRLPEKMVICHLGSGSSVIAVKNGQGADTSMGFSPLEGLVMATRSGTIDLTAARALQEALGLDDDSAREYLNSQSGLLGLSGASSDIRELLKRENAGDYRAGLALKTYIYRVQQTVGGMAASLGGIDALVFTGTVGERAPIIRQRIISRLNFLEFELDLDKNAACTERLEKPRTINAQRHRPIYVVPANEEREMAQAASSFPGSL